MDNIKTWTGVRVEVSIRMTEDRDKWRLGTSHAWLPSVGFRSWSPFLAVSLQVTWIVNPAVGCHYFSPGPQLPFRPVGRHQFRCFVNRRTMGVNILPKTYPTASRLRFKPRPYWAWVQHTNHSVTEPPDTSIYAYLFNTWALLLTFPQNPDVSSCYDCEL